MKKVPPPPSILVEKFHLILMAMCSLQHDFTTGATTEMNRHVIARAVALRFPEDFVVVDGYVLRLAPTRRGKKYGEEVFLRSRFGNRAGMARRLRELPHSWLSWKQDPFYLIDVCPLGGVIGASPPVLIHQDHSSIWYEKKGLPQGVTEESLQDDVESFGSRFKERFEEMFFG